MANSRIAPGVLCYLKNMHAQMNNGAIVEVVNFWQSTGTGNRWWHCRATGRVIVQGRVSRILGPAANILCEEKHLVPISGPDLGLSESDIKELYESEGIPCLVPADLERVR